MDGCRELVHWLLDNGGPAIRCRTATELTDDGGGMDLERLVADLVQSPMAQMWLARVGQPSESLSSFHHSKPEAFENVASKLCDLGLRAGMPALDQSMRPFQRWLDAQAQAVDDIAETHCTDVVTKEAAQSAVERWLHRFEVRLIVARLAWMGYDTPTIRTCLSRRLNTLYALAKTGNHDIYIDQDTFGDYSNNAFRKRPLVSPQFNGMLPSIHDIYALAHYPKESLNQQVQHEIDTVITYILHPNYQSLNRGYGVMRAGPRRYFAMGWSVHLPGYDGFEFSRAMHAHMFVQRLELMAHFPVARQSQWFASSLQHLEGYRTKRGTYRFPAGYLREQASGYWVQGAYMRLEENRRLRLSLELDSTFRMCKIKRLVEKDAH